MKLVKPRFEIWEQPAGLEGIYKMIEKAGRICYRSSDKITEDSAKPFVDRMIKSGHGAMLEHGTVYLYNPGDKQMPDMINRYSGNPYSRLHVVKADLTGAIIGPVWITTNYRVIVENNWVEDLLYRVNPAPLHPRRITVHFICDRGILAEFTRHRTFSFSAESTRYCNYSKDKFGNEITFIEPCWLEDYNYEGNTYYSGFLVALRAAEANYFDLMKKWEDRIPDKRYKTGFRNNPWTPQQARAVLPNALKTELVMTGFASDWKHFFELRDDNSAHPQAQELAHPLHEEFVKRGYIVDNK